MQLMTNFQYLSLENLKIFGVLRMLIHFRVDTGHNGKVGWITFGALERKFLKESKNCINNQQLPTTPKNWQPFQYFLNIFTTKHHVCPSVNGPRARKVLKCSLTQTFGYVGDTFRSGSRFAADFNPLCTRVT